MTEDLNPELPTLLADVEARIDSFLIEFNGLTIIHDACTPDHTKCYCVEFHEEVETPLGLVILEYVTGWYSTQTRAVYDAYLMWQGEVDPMFVQHLEGLD